MRIYVGNLPYQASEEEVRQAFQAYGEVSSVSLVVDKFTGMPKGFGFVEMTSRDQGLAAIEGLRGKQLGGRTLTVDEARPKGGPAPGPSHGFGGRRPANPGR